MYKFFILSFMLVACSQVEEKLGLPEDNFIEEIIEEVIEQKTGIDIDLTPSTPE